MFLIAKFSAKYLHRNDLTDHTESNPDSCDENELENLISFILHPLKILLTISSPPNSPLRLSRIRFALIFVLSLSEKILATGDTEICPGFRIKEIGGITCELRKEILEAHNDIRQTVAAGLAFGQPPAANMHKLYWDEELAEGAQDWANHCEFKHNDLAERKIARFSVGQNIAVTKNRGRTPDGKEFSRQVKNWYNEQAVYNFGRINGEIEKTGHYTQLIWAETYLIGCGFSRFEELISNISFRLYVCNYGPSGNVHGEIPYEIGDINCPEGSAKSLKYSALCALKSAPPDSCETLEMNPQKNVLQRVLKTARRSGFFENYQPVYKNRRNLSPIRFYDDREIENLDPKEMAAVFIFFKFVLRIF